MFIWNACAKALAFMAKRRDESGQATPEYALVILAAVALAATLIVWAKKSGAMGQLFSFVMSRVQEAADK